MKFSKDIRLIIAVFTVAIVWGTTFLGIKIGVETIPPWFVAGIRQFLAALILMVFLLFRKELTWIGRKNFIVQITLSSLMLIMANGLTTVAEAHVSSSLASLVSSMSPIMVLIGSLMFGLEKFSYRSLAGILLGFSGVVFIFWNGISDLANPNYLSGIFLLFLAICGWAGGTIYTKKIQYRNENLFLNLFYQFAFAGIVQLVFAFIFSENFDFSTWSGRSILATLYLALFGSVAAYFAFNYALKRLLPTQVSMLSYVNTVIAIFLGWLVLNEEITLKFIVAAVLIISGVFMMNYKHGMFAKK
ncbi:MAG: EamA family transporter [Weeksellaceae bacterium]|nr:EamA family transporter [Weeksellaceae bacterium]